MVTQNELNCPDLFPSSIVLICMDGLSFQQVCLVWHFHHHQVCQSLTVVWVLLTLPVLGTSSSRTSGFGPSYHHFSNGQCSAYIRTSFFLGDQVDWASVTKKVRGSSPKSAGHPGGRRQPAVARFATTSYRLVLCLSMFRGHGCRSSPYEVDPTVKATCPFYCIHASSLPQKIYFCFWFIFRLANSKRK